MNDLIASVPFLRFFGPANIPVALDSAVTFKTDFRAAAIP